MTFSIPYMLDIDNDFIGGIAASANDFHHPSELNGPFLEAEILSTTCCIAHGLARLTVCVLIHIMVLKFQFYFRFLTWQYGGSMVSSGYSILSQFLFGKMDSAT